MKKTYTLILLLVLLPFAAIAEDWNHIRTSGEYYYGVGHGATEAEATEAAMSELVGMIATHVSSEFVGIDLEETANGSVEHRSKVLNCVKTYSQATLTNVEKWPEGQAPDITMRCWIKRSELYKIYELRIEKAKDMVEIADECLEKGKVDMALQYYYWAYSLVRSLQRPNEVKGRNGRILMNWLPVKIEEVLSDVDVTFEKRDGDCVDLLFNYKGKPASSLEYTYSDGREDCAGKATDGRGTLYMAPGYETDAYHLSIDYEYKGQARGDIEMESVLNIISRKTFSKAQKDLVMGKGADKPKSYKTGVELKPTDSQLVADAQSQSSVIAKVVDAITTKNYSSAIRYFTLEGLDRYNKLISYGKGRVVGEPNIKFFKGMDGQTVARGMQMSFVFNNGTKKTFVEDVVFTLDTDNKICNVAFGLGQVAENDILCKKAGSWDNETRELLMEFLENYKTAYCLKDIGYLEAVFDDQAVIIVGNVARRTTATPAGGERPISLKGQDVIHYNRYTKNQYLANLKRCFAKNEFINIRFTNNDVQKLDKFEKEELFGIQIGQEYNSTTYGDMGYLFLLVDMTDHSLPQIKVRTWQPNETSMEKIYHAGWFYGE